MGVKRRELLINAGSMAAILAGGELTSADMASAHRSHLPTRWQQEADIVVIGSGATGLPAAIVARESGASVIVIEAENHIGGHAITSGGNISLGGGTSVQKRYGINDSPDLLFRDLTDWSVVEPNGFPGTMTVKSFAPSPTTAPGPSNGSSLRGSFSLIRRPSPVGYRSATRCRGKRTARCWTGQWCRQVGLRIRCCAGFCRRERA